MKKQKDKDILNDEYRTPNNEIGCEERLKQSVKKKSSKNKNRLLRFARNDGGKKRLESRSRLEEKQTIINY